MTPRIDVRSRAFWELAAPWASITLLARWFPPQDGGLSKSGWQHAIDRAKALYPDLQWLALSRALRLDDAPDEPPFDPPRCELCESAEAALQDSIEERRSRQEAREYKRLYEQVVKEEDLLDRFCQALDERIRPYKPVAFEAKKASSAHSAEAMVMLVSDYHLGEKVSAEETGGLGAYDMAIASARWREHVLRAVSIKERLAGYTLDELVVVVLGDMVSGTIHDELNEAKDAHVVDVLVEGGDMIASGILELAKRFERVRVEWHIGNHGRLSKRVRYKERYASWDYLLGHVVELRLSSQPNIAFTNHKSFWSITEVKDHRLLNLHGDNIRGWAGVPYYGINRAVANLSALLASRGHGDIDIVNLGHFHATGLIERMEADVVLNGSPVGPTEFSIGALFSGTRARQVVYGVHPKRGRTWMFNIDLEEVLE